MMLREVIDMGTTIVANRSNDPAVAAARTLRAAQLCSERNTAGQSRQTTELRSSAFTRGTDQKSLEGAEKAAAKPWTVGTKAQVDIARRVGDLPPGIVELLERDNNVLPDTLKIIDETRWNITRMPQVRKAR
jgi:hypothetical protein